MTQGMFHVGYFERAMHATFFETAAMHPVLDVWEKEPPQASHPLLAHPAVLASPHTAGVTHESRARVARMAAEAFAAFAAGQVPPRLLNPQALPRSPSAGVLRSSLSTRESIAAYMSSARLSQKISLPFRCTLASTL